MAEAASPGSPGVPGSDTTLDRLIRILGAFDADRPLLSVAALARRAQLPVPTTYRWVERLVASGLLRRQHDGVVGPGLRLWELAARSAPTTSLQQAAMPFLDDVQAVLRQHTQLAVLDEAGVLVLERLSARGAVPNRASVAGRLPAFTSAMGLTLLAFSPRWVTEPYLERHAHELGAPLADPGADEGPPNRGAGSARGVVNPTLAELRRQLADVRRQGYASLDGLIDTEAMGLAVPVFGPERAGEAALGVVVPRQSDLAPGVAPLLMAAARGISRAHWAIAPDILTE